MALEGEFTLFLLRLAINEWLAVANSFAWIHTSRYIAIYYILMKLDNNDQTYNGVIRKQRAYCIHTALTKHLYVKLKTSWQELASRIKFGFVFGIIFFRHYFFPTTTGLKTRNNMALVRVHPALSTLSLLKSSYEVNI